MNCHGVLNILGNLCIGQSLAISFHTSENWVQSRLLQPPLIKNVGVGCNSRLWTQFLRGMDGDG